VSPPFARIVLYWSLDADSGVQYAETYNINTLPLLVCSHAVIPLNPFLESPEGDYAKGLQVLVNGLLEEDSDVEIVLPGDVGSSGPSY